MPEYMPPTQSLANNGGQQTPVRVIERWKHIALNPYVVLAVTLQALNSIYLPLPDASLQSIERECLDIRAGWNEIGLAIWSCN